MAKGTRIQRNVFARRERALLTWLCERLPIWVSPDSLTLVGVFGAILVFVSYLLSRSNPGFLWLASLGFVVHWFGDSLDGSLARYRNCERPIYGYFLDHTVDAICNLVIMAGLGLTVEVRMDAALYALIGYYLLCMYVFINNHLSGVFRLSFFGFGPTELRVGLICLNIWMYFTGHVSIVLGQQVFTPYDIVLIGAGSLFALLFTVQMLQGIRTLRDPQRSGAATLTGLVPPHSRASASAQSPSRNVSRGPK